MRAALHRVESDCLKPIYDNLISKEETLELVVPDVSADIGKILDVRGQFLLASQKAKTDEIHIGGTVEVSVIYTAEDSGRVQYLMTSIPFDMAVPVTGADDNSKLVSRWELCCMEARMLNPRKLLLKACVSGHIVVYAPDKFALWDNLSEGEKAPVYILKKEAAHTLVVGVREKSFVVSDEYKLPADRDQNSKMISASTEVCMEDAKSVGNKIVIKAVAKTAAVFLCETDGSLFDCMFTTQFSQIIEVDSFGDNIMSAVNIQLRDAEFTVGSGRDTGPVYTASLHMNAQAVCRDNRVSTYIADAYSNEFKINMETADIKLMKNMPQNPLMLSAKCRMKPIENLAEIMYLCVSELCTEAEGNEIRVTVKLGGVGRCENGELEPLDMKLTADEKIELMRNQRLAIVSVCCDKPMMSGTAQNADISVGIELMYCVIEHSDICAVDSIEVCEDCPIRACDRPSLIVLCSDKESDLWCLAKKYGSTVDMIERANSFGDGFTAGCRPLLIPRAR